MGAAAGAGADSAEEDGSGQVREAGEAQEASPLPEPPEIFVCPITQELMQDPVMATDGHTYERHAVERWFATRLTSPKTGAALDLALLLPNHAMRHQIIEWREAHGWK